MLNAMTAIHSLGIWNGESRRSVEVRFQSCSEVRRIVARQMVVVPIDDQICVPGWA